MKRFFLFAISCLFLTTTSLTSPLAAKRSSKRMTEDALLWKAAAHAYQSGLTLAHALLQREHERNISSVGERLRVRSNASGIKRITKAYKMYLQKISKVTKASTKKVFSSFFDQLDALFTAAEETESSAVKGKINDEAKGALKKLLAVKTYALPAKAQALDKKQKMILLEAAQALGTGTELLSYYRIRQLNPLLGSKKTRAAAMKTLEMLSSQFLTQLRIYRVFRKLYPKAGFGLYTYHAALLYRCAKWLYLSHKKPKGRVAYQKRLKMRMTQLVQSLKKTNTGFAKLWKNAANE